MTMTGVRRGRDGKSYPASPLSRQERGRAIRMAHELVCVRGLSIRAAQAQMAAAGVRRSRGIIGHDLDAYECPACAEVAT